MTARTITRRRRKWDTKKPEKTQDSMEGKVTDRKRPIATS